MLDRTQTFRCIECGLPERSPLFHYHYGNPANGPAYWCDRGMLCSPRCSLAHHRRRLAEGTAPQRPAPDPLLRVR